MNVPDELITAFAQLVETAKPIETWCENVEKLLITPSKARTIQFSDDSSEKVLSGINLLHENLLLQMVHQDDSQKYDFQLNAVEYEEQTKCIVEEWKSAGAPISESTEAIVRACKTFLRWLLQLYIPSRREVTNELEAMRKFKSISMLEAYLLLIEKVEEPELLRHTGNLLFYSTFNLIPTNDEQSTKAFTFLVDKGNVFPLLLKKLLYCESIPACVVLTRNIHNIAGSYAPAIRSLNATRVLRDTNGRSNIASWAPSNAPDGFSFLSLSQNLLLHAISAEPPFPGDEKDLRSELVQEILRTYYAMRIGQNIHCDPQLVNSLCRVLKLKESEKRCRDCQSAAVSVLMDATVETAGLLQENEAVRSMLRLLEAQVGETLGGTRVDDTGAAALTPILVVLYKFCQSDPSFRQVIKSQVFPPSDEDHFRDLVAEETKTNSKAKNMSPLDAPEGTLRHKMIKLLTWPESHIKRFAGELLWLLCDSNPQEFVHRVGMGSGMPIMASKGFAQMPSHAYS